MAVCEKFRILKDKEQWKVSQISVQNNIKKYSDITHSDFSASVADACYSKHVVVSPKRDHLIHAFVTCMFIEQDAQTSFQHYFNTSILFDWIGGSKFHQRLNNVNILGGSQFFTMVNNTAINVFGLWQIQEDGWGNTDQPSIFSSAMDNAV